MLAGIYASQMMTVSAPVPLPPWAPDGTIGIPITTDRFEEYYSEGGTTVISGGVATVTRTEPASRFGATYSSLRALGSWDDVINGTLVVAYRVYNVDITDPDGATTIETGGGRNGFVPFGEDSYAIRFQTPNTAGTDATRVSAGEVLDSTSLNLNIGFLFSKSFQNGQITFVGIVPFPNVGATIYSRDWADGLLTGQTLYGSSSPAQSVVSGRMRISSNALTDAKSRLTAIADLADFDLTFVAYPTTGGDVGVVYRTAYWGNANDTFAYYVGVTTTDVSIGLGSNSSSPAYTPLRSVVKTTASGNPVTIRLQVKDTLHKVWINGTLEMCVVDTTHTAAGGFGVRRYSATSGFGEIDDFELKAIS